MPEKQAMQFGNVSGAVIVGDGNTVNQLTIHADSDSNVIVHTGPLPDPVKRHPISQLPRPATEPLIGREEDLQTLRAALGANKVVQLWGTAGVGKSALLRHLACTLPGGSDGVAYIEAGGRTADDIAQAIFDISFDAPNYKPSAEVLKQHLETLYLRIYLDDTGLDHAELRRLFDMAKQSAFVFTSQQPSAANGVHQIRLAGLSAAAGARLVQAVLPRELRPDEVRTVTALSNAVDGNPLRLRRIASSAASGRGLPGITDLPGLLPALLNTLTPAERDLLHLLSTLSGAELAARQLNTLLGRTDAEGIAEGLVRHGLLIASETGYGCPPDVADCVLNSRMTEYPAEPLCRALTAWVEARDTAPDDVAAHFRALDAAVLRAERGGQAQLGLALARAASPKLALSRQFDAWGSLLGTGWAVAKSTGNTAAEEFFVREARSRRKAIGTGLQRTALVLEAEALWHELAALRAHSTAHQIGAQASFPPPPGSPAPPVHPPTIAHPVPPTPGPPPPVHPTVVRPVVNLSNSAPQPPSTAPHVPAAHAPAPHVPTQVTQSRVDLSNANTQAQNQAHTQINAQAHTQAHTQATTATHSTHAANSATTAAQPAHAATGATAAGTGHGTVAAVGAAGAKGGLSALALTCTLGLVAVVGVGAVVYADNQPSAAPVVTSFPSFSFPPVPTFPPVPAPWTPPVDDSTPTPTTDPACAIVYPAWPSEIDQFNTDGSTLGAATDAYNRAVDSYNSGQTSTTPDDSTMHSDAGTVVGDLNSMEATLHSALSQAQDSSVVADLNGMLTPTQQDIQLYQAFESGQTRTYDDSSQSTAMNSADLNLISTCYD
ncbi:ATP-binding protein [Kitasatospora sp. NBC_01266]|uniref:ATP-binding protein n=1 Tax=Kitasatospora sp. NBC_01266 TaxID=2903572 RepID=UPI002E32B567|nr:ATP-binding protein [Kitasatospora sp. NBC_01266]